MKALTLLLLAVLFLTSAALKRHQLKQQMNKQFSNDQSQGEEDPEATEAMNRMMAFIFGDEEIMSALLSGGEITPSAMKKMVSFYLQDPYYSQQVISQMQNDPSSSWISNLSTDNKKKVVRISMETMMEDPSFNIMGGEASMANLKLSDQTTSKLVDRLINENDEIAGALLSSIDQLAKDKATVDSLKSLNPSWKDWDFSKLTVAQKKEIYTWMSENQPPKEAHHKHLFTAPKFKHLSFLGLIKH